MTDLKSNRFSGIKLQNVIIQLISLVTLQEDVVATEKLFSIWFLKNQNSQYSECSQNMSLENNKTGYHSGIYMCCHYMTTPACIITPPVWYFH